MAYAVAFEVDSEVGVLQIGLAHIEPIDEAGAFQVPRSTLMTRRRIVPACVFGVDREYAYMIASGVRDRE
jgi:hypothetical protein